MLRSSLLCDTVQLAIDDRLLILNSAADPFVEEAAQRIVTGELLLAEDNIAALHSAQTALDRENQGRRPIQWRHVPFHEYTLHEAPATIDVAVMNMLYQPGNAWMHYALEMAASRAQIAAWHPQGVPGCYLRARGRHLQRTYHPVAFVYLQCFDIAKQCLHAFGQRQDTAIFGSLHVEAPARFERIGGDLQRVMHPGIARLVEHVHDRH